MYVELRKRGEYWYCRIYSNKVEGKRKVTERRIGTDEEAKKVVKEELRRVRGEL